MKGSKWGWLTLLLIFILAGCVVHEELPVETEGVSFTRTGGRGMRSSVVEEFVPCGDRLYVDLTAGQNIHVGRIYVSNNGDKVEVDVVVIGGWKLNKIDLHIATTVGGIPTTQKGNPKIGNFDYHYMYEPPVTEAIIREPLPAGHGEMIYLAFHADVTKEICDTETQEETAWAGCVDFPGASWASYISYTVKQCDAIPE